MRITLISHASAIVETDDVVLWSDPWLSGTAFNDSWRLLPEPPRALIDAWVPRVTHLYISHEHPDHFHVPSLRELPDDFKRRVTLVFQKLHTERMTSAIRRLGFSNVVSMRHRELLRVSGRTRLYLYQCAPLDSVLGVVADKTVLDVNDAELSRYDTHVIRRDLGRIDAILDQFSFATYDGREEHAVVAPAQARRVLESLSDDHIQLGSKATIPFASFMYFCAADNAYLNAYANRTRTVHEHFESRNLKLILLRPGDTWEVDAHWSNGEALAYYDEISASDRPAIAAKAAEPEALVRAANEMIREMHRYFPRLLLWLVGSFVIRVPDLDRSYRLDVPRRCFVPSEAADWDLQVNSQPLLFAFETTYGMQTLSISGRFRLRRKHRRFLLLRVLMGLRNAEIYLRPKYLAAPAFREFVWDNRARLGRQALGWLGVLRSFVR